MSLNNRNQRRFFFIEKLNNCTYCKSKFAKLRKKYTKDIYGSNSKNTAKSVEEFKS